MCESALSQLDLSVAEKAFVKCSDYAGLQFVKKLRKMDVCMKVFVGVNALCTWLIFMCFTS